MKLKILLATGALAVALTPAPAMADWLFTPNVGGVFGGKAKFGDTNSVKDDVKKRTTFGASVGWMGAGIIGDELDLGFTPNFFKDTRSSGQFTFGDSNVTTLMGNLLLGVPVGGQRGPGIRPYAVGGVGLIRTHINGTSLFNDLRTDDFGVNVGGGVMGFFNNAVGLRGDVRYFRSLQDTNPNGRLDVGLGDFNFWRGSLGLVLRW